MVKMTNKGIKFRGWNGKEMVYNVAVRNSLIINYPDKFDCKNGEINYLVMQFTGLLDSKGNEIYEGDILKCWDDCVVEEWSRFILGEIKYLINTFTLETGFTKTNDRFYKYDNFEIIGNVYQNIELLK